MPADQPDSAVDLASPAVRLVYPVSVALALIAIIALNPVALSEEVVEIMHIASGLRRKVVRRCALLVAGVVDMFGPLLIGPIEKLLALRRPSAVALSPRDYFRWLRPALRWIVTPLLLAQGVHMLDQRRVETLGRAGGAPRPRTAGSARRAVATSGPQLQQRRA